MTDIIMQKQVLKIAMGLVWDSLRIGATVRVPFLIRVHVAVQVKDSVLNKH